MKGEILVHLLNTGNTEDNLSHSFDTTVLFKSIEVLTTFLSLREFNKNRIHSLFPLVSRLDS